MEVTWIEFGGVFENLVHIAREPGAPHSRTICFAKRKASEKERKEDSPQKKEYLDIHTTTQPQTRNVIVAPIWNQVEPNIASTFIRYI